MRPNQGSFSPSSVSWNCEDYPVTNEAIQAHNGAVPPSSEILILRRIRKPEGNNAGNKFSPRHASPENSEFAVCLLSYLTVPLLFALSPHVA